MIKRVLRWAGVVVLLLLLGAGGFVFAQVSAFDRSLERVYDVKVEGIVASQDPAVIERGRHLAESLGGCTACHGDDLGGKPGEPMGPIGVLHAPNLTTGKGGVGKQYSDAQLARVVRHGLKADGTTVRFMPSQDFSWWPDEDLIALVSYLRTVPPVDRVVPDGQVGVLGKILDRMGMFSLDVASRIDHDAPRPKTLVAEPTPEYGKHLALLCKGCHGETLSGGPIPGAPPDLPVPSNLTPHASGIAAYTEAEFVRLLETGVKRDGKKLDPFMPFAAFGAMNETEKKALWSYLRSIPPKPFGGR